MPGALRMISCDKVKYDFVYMVPMMCVCVFSVLAVVGRLTYLKNMI